jgi:carboxypeptidase Q
VRSLVVLCLGVVGLSCTPGPRPPAAPGAGLGPTGATTVREPLDAVGIEIDAMSKMALAAPRSFEIVRSLTDEVGARSAGSPGDKVAVAWARRTLEANGLRQVRTEPVTVSYWARGEESGAVVSPVQQRLALTALGGSVGTSGLQAEVVEFDGLASLAQADRSRVAGKIVFLDTVMNRTQSGVDYGRVVPIRSQGAAAAAKLGAVGLVIRSVGTDHNRLPHTGAMKPAEIPAAALAVPDAEMLHRLVAAGPPVRIAMTLGARVVGDADSANVMGEVRGRELPTEIVLLAAHLDSWDLATGAIDDGAGCAIVIEAARLIAARPRPPRRTVRVVLFANEEHGLSGALAYAKAHQEEATHHAAALESDFGTGRVYAVHALGGPSTSAVVASLAAHTARLGVTAGAEEAHGGADISPLRELGVPVVDLRQDGTTYFDFHHTANDTLDKVDPEALEQAALAFASAAYELAEGPLELGRVPEDKRKSKW